MPSDTGVVTLPIFPLNSVLFPHVPIALHIFEERYREMVRDLPATDNRFCVALISEGVEVGGEAVPHQIGCVAEVVHLKRLEDGRYYLVALGEERVRILSTDRESKPYLLGSVAAYPDTGTDVDPRLVDEAADLFTQYVNCLLDLVGESHEELSLPAEAAALSFIVASALQAPSEVKQQLLELQDGGQRLDAEIQIMQAELPLLHVMLVGPKPGAQAGPFSAN
jgi:uncharacterized protein